MRRDLPHGEAFARRFFALLNDGDHDALLRLVHPDVEATVRLRGGAHLHGIEQVEQFLRDDLGARPMFEVTVHDVRALDERRVVVDARMRWMDDDRMLRDDPVVWALELEDGLLLRSTPVRTVSEAEAVLSASPGDGSTER